MSGEIGRPAFWLDAVVKSALLGLLILAAIRPSFGGFEGKAMIGRELAYPVTALIVPLAWWCFGRPRRASYPYAMDILLVLPFLIDVAGNAADLYDTVEWWDDANHFVNWALLTGAFGQLLLRLPVGRLSTAGLVIGFGAVTAVLWELAEYVAFIRNSPELATAYTDTLGDLVLGLSGSTIAAIATVLLLWRRPA